MRNTRESDAAGPFRPQRAPRPDPDPAPSRAVGPVSLVAAAALLAGILQAAPARAADFSEDGLEIRLDTTVSHGVTFRVEERDAGLAADTNGNDGNLNYDRGLVSNTSKFTTDLDVRSGDFGAFVRAAGFIDFENENGTRERTPLSGAARDRVGRNLDVLDAYVTGRFDAGDAVVNARLGRHVLNWGESTFIPNGINVVNHFDVSKLRLPGSELREALLPVGLASVSVSPTDILSAEAFYQFEWKETEIDPVGSYFSSVDYAGPGATRAVITDLTASDRGFGFGPLTQAINADLAVASLPGQPAFDPHFANVPRGPDRPPEDTGQWGFATRYFAEDLNGTEFGVYVLNYHSRLPTLSARTGGRDALAASLAAAGAVGEENGATVQAVTGAVSAEVLEGVAAGSIPPAAAPAVIGAQVAEKVGEIAAALAVDRFGRSAQYFVEYPEDIQLLGLSFNTALGTSGWALQGEYSFRRDAPLQRAERVVIEEGLQPVVTGLELAACASDPSREGCPRDPASGEPLPAQFFGGRLAEHLAHYAPRRIQGYIRRDVSQFQATATKALGPVMGADGAVFVAEAAAMRVHGMPDKAAMPLESPAGGVLAVADADATSWGYRLAARLDYNNAVGPVNLYPYTQFLHDVSGNSPAPSGPFVEGRTALTLGLRADYLSNWQADLSYTRLAGDGNELSDRDFVSASVKYSF